MHPFAPKKPASDSGHPGDEELAAYVDGMLVGEEKTRVTEHLAACADCYRVYSETLRFQWAEEEEEQRVAASAAATETVVPFPSDRKSKTPWRLAAAAAVLVVGLGAGWFMLVGPAPEMTTAEMVSPLQGQEDLGQDLWRGRTDRSGGGGKPVEDLFSNERLFQIGVQLVNLQVALEQGNEAASDDVLGRLVSLLYEEPFVKDYEDYYAGIRVAISEEDVPPRSFLQESTAKSEELREFLGPDPYLELGRFVEAGRLAAIAQEPSFFEQRGTRLLLRTLLKHEKKGELEVEPATLKTLEAISKRMEKEPLQTSDYAALRGQFEEILQEYYPQSS